MNFVAVAIVSARLLTSLNCILLCLNNSSQKVFQKKAPDTI